MELSSYLRFLVTGASGRAQWPRVQAKVQVNLAARKLRGAAGGGTLAVDDFSGGLLDVARRVARVHY